MKKKIIIAVIIIICVLLAGVGVFIGSRMLMKFPDTVAYGDGANCYTDEGMYYVKNNYLYFLDADNGSNSIVCNKANCKHDADNCPAHIVASCIMYYNGCIYAADDDVLVYVDEKDGEAIGVYEASIKFKQIKEDGSAVKEIYTADNGGITSMKAVDGVIYFTAYTYTGGFQLDRYLMDWTLYAYDLRWNKLEPVLTYQAGEENEGSSIEIVAGNSNDIYIMYRISYKDGTHETQLKKYVDGENIDVATYWDEYASPDNYSLDDVRFLINDDGQFVVHSIYEDGDDYDYLYIYETEDFTNDTLIISAENSWVDYLNGHLYVIVDDYNRILYDYVNRKYYVSNTAFVGEGTYMSNIYNMFPDDDIAYIDAHDYTGLHNGDILYEDITDRAVVRWSTFFEENFTPLDDVSEEEKEKFDWIEIYNQ